MNTVFIAIFTILLGFSTSYSLAAHERQKLIVATAQYEIEGNLDNDSLFKKVSNLATEAKQLGADILLLPELVTLDLTPFPKKIPEPELLADIADRTSGKYLDLLVSLSTSLKLTIIGGSTPWRQGDKIFNVALVTTSDGEVKKQKKVHLTAWERQFGMAGGSSIQVHEVFGIRFAILICYDSEFPDLSLSLMQERPEIIFVPSMTESPEGADRVRWASQARVIEQTAYVVSAVTTGSSVPDWQHFGRASILAPRIPTFEAVLVEGDGRSHGLSIAELDISKLRKARVDSPWQPAKDLISGHR